MAFSNKLIIQHFEGKIASPDTDPVLYVDTWADTEWYSLGEAEGKFPKDRYRMIIIIEGE